MATRFLHATLLCLGLAWAAAVPAKDPPAIAVVPGPNLLVDGIPPLERVQRDEPAELRLLRFVDWHPLRPEMLVLARIGARAQLHRLNEALGQPEALTRGKDAVAGARWEPGAGEYLVYSQDQGGDESYRLYRLTPGQPPVALTSPTARVSDFAFLPAGRGLVYLLEQLDRYAADDRESRTTLMWTDPLDPTRKRQLGEVRNGRFGALRVTEGGAVIVTRTQGGRHQLWRFDVDGGEARPLGEARPVAGQGEDEAALWSREAVDGDHRHLLRTDPDSGARRSLLVDLPGDLEAIAVAPSSARRPIAMAHNQQGISVLRLFDPAPATAPPRAIAADLPAGVASNLAWHPKLPLLAFNHVSAQNPGRVIVYDLARDAHRPWSGTAAMPSGVEYRTLRWKSFDGLEITALHIAPPVHFEGRRPVYIAIHGGPSSQARPGYLAGLNRHLVESLGMHLILPNVRGSDGFGQRFLNLDNGRRREDAVKDISALLDLIGEREDMDPSRVIVSGGSYGGYMALAVAVHESARIAGSICRVGIANFVSFLENTESYRREARRIEYGDERDPAMREFLRQVSPLTHADKLRKPLFVVHGRNDPRVPYSEAEQMVKAVRAQGTAVWFLTAEDEGHSFTSAANRDYLFNASVEFVRRVIAGQALTGEAR